MEADRLHLRAAALARAGDLAAAAELYRCAGQQGWGPCGGAYQRCCSQHSTADQSLAREREGSLSVPGARGGLQACRFVLTHQHAALLAGRRRRGLALASPDDWAAWALFLDCLLPATAAEGAGTRFPVGVVGGLAELWDRRHPWRWQQQRWQEQGGAAPDAQAAWRVGGARVQRLACGGECISGGAVE